MMGRLWLVPHKSKSFLQTKTLIVSLLAIGFLSESVSAMSRSNGNNQFSMSDQAICATVDLNSLFFDDYFPNTRWSSAESVRTIRWSSGAMHIANNPVTRPFTANERGIVQTAFSMWDEALDSINFIEVTDKESPEIIIAWTAIDDFPSLGGRWTSNWNSQNLRYMGTVRINQNDPWVAAAESNFFHIVLHELGNVLGMGDIASRADIESVQEDPMQPPFGPKTLSGFDRRIIRQIYGESTCDEVDDSNSVTTTSTTVAATSSTTVRAVTIRYRITCKNKQKTRVLVRSKPLCPIGFQRLGPVVKTSG